jgi:hypothetical protein
VSEEPTPREQFYDALRAAFAAAQPVLQAAAEAFQRLADVTSELVEAVGGIWEAFCAWRDALPARARAYVFRRLAYAGLGVTRPRRAALRL